jgi:hypothetical protein
MRNPTSLLLGEYSLLPFPYSLLPDFWSRQANTPTESFEFAPFGLPAQIAANRPEILAAAHLSAARFSRSPNLQPSNVQLTNLPPSNLRSPTSNPQSPLSIQLVMTAQSTPPLPPDLPERLGYNGLGEWISLSAGEWGYALAHLPTHQAAAFLSPALAADVRLVSRYIIDHYLLNFLLTEWAMLHASCVLSPDGRRLIVMVAPHHTGKSTTALHLLRAGYYFLADGMALLQQVEGGWVVGGYPIGEVKLRDDVLALFPEYSGQAVMVREQRKTVVNLRLAHPDRLVETLFTPALIQICYGERSGDRRTQIRPLALAEAAPLLAANTVYWDTPERLAHNTMVLELLLQTAQLYHLQIGTEQKGIVSALDNLA